MDRPRDPNDPNAYDPGADRPSDVPVRAEDAETPDMFGGSQNQGHDGQSQTLGGMTQSLDSSVGVQGAVSPDTTIGGSQGEGPAHNEAQERAADVIMGASGDVVEPAAPTEGTNSDPKEPNAVDTVTYEGKTVFSPHELNQSGEDKEYFPPDKGHRYEVPKDANDHALTPDIEVRPEQKIGKVE
jgi:hypothetical protein